MYSVLFQTSVQFIKPLESAPLKQTTSRLQPRIVLSVSEWIPASHVHLNRFIQKSSLMSHKTNRKTFDQSSYRGPQGFGKGTLIQMLHDAHPTRFTRTASHTPHVNLQKVKPREAHTFPWQNQNSNHSFEKTLSLNIRISAATTTAPESGPL